MKEEYAGIDHFRLIAAFLVVAIHAPPLIGISEIADLVLTIIARVAVPFFFVTSGFFMFVRSEDERQRSGRLVTFLVKIAVLYGGSILLYLPLNVYTGTIGEWRHLPSLLKDIVFHGTFYHLWYLPATIIGACVALLLLSKFSVGQSVFVGLLLYSIGLFGDSYYGISSRIPLLKASYDRLFSFSDYTRNGLFFAPVFFVLGALLAQQTKRMHLKTCLTGLAVSVALMLTEGLLLYSYDVQRHDSMYLMLLPCVFFLFQSLLWWKGRSLKHLRNVSMLIYLIHPAVIVAVRGLAKACGLEEVLIDNSLFHNMAVASGSLVSAIVLAALLRGKCMRRIALGAGPAGAMDRAWVEVRTDNLRHNVSAIQRALPSGCEMMAVVKANAYGHGSVPVSLCLNRIGIHAFAVATIDEGICLREEGVTGEILILGYTPAMRASELSHYCLSQTVVDAEHARELNRSGRPIRVHIKVDTGMRRLGEDCRHVSEIAGVFGCYGLRIEGIFTHLCVSDSIAAADASFTNQQIQRFYGLLDELERRCIQVPKVHIQSSYGVLNCPEVRCDYARVGIALYGVLSTPDEDTRRSVDLRPVLALRSRVAIVRTISRGDSVGYGRSFVARDKMKVAVVTIGYGDGVPRSLSNGHGCVLIGGRRAPIIGQICMDQLTIDVTGIPGVGTGSVVTLIGGDGADEIKAEQMAADAGTITNELLSRLDSRLERVVC